MPKYLSGTTIASSMAKKTCLVSVRVSILLSSSNTVLALSHDLSAVDIVSITQVLDMPERVKVA